MNPMLSFGRLLIILGAIFLLTGGALYLLGRSGIHFTNFPGNIRFQFGNSTCVLALGVSILLSILLTIGLNLAARFLNR
jgi:hypothetical protein